MATNQFPGLQAEDADIVFAVQADELICTKAQLLDGRPPSWSKSCTDTILPVDIYHAGSELGLISSDCQE